MRPEEVEISELLSASVRDRVTQVGHLHARI
jgi:hypothetical protein